MNVFGIFYQLAKDNTLLFCTREIKSIRKRRDVRKKIPVHFDTHTQIIETLK